MSESLKGFRMMLKWDKLPSVNTMYTRTKVGITLSKEARSFKTEVAKQVRAQMPKKLPFGPKDVFKLSCHFIIASRFFVRDTSNFVKLVEDCIFEELDINDARNIEIEAKKSHLPKSKYEYIKVTVEKSDFNYNFFNEDNDDIKPESSQLEDRMYSKEEVEEYYAKGLFDSMKWALHADLPKTEFEDYIKEKYKKKK